MYQNSYPVYCFLGFERCNKFLYFFSVMIVCTSYVCDMTMKLHSHGKGKKPKPTFVQCDEGDLQWENPSLLKSIGSRNSDQLSAYLHIVIVSQLSRDMGILMTFRIRILCKFSPSCTYFPCALWSISMVPNF